MHTIYYAILLVGSLVIALVVYGIAMLGWRSFRHRLPAGQRSPGGRLDRVFLFSYSASIIKYRRRGGGGGGVEEATSCGGGGDDDEIINEECVVCLSGFEEGDDVRQMPRCKHLFHAGCIDMWLYSHSHCPLCRSPVDRPALYSEPSSMEYNNSQEVMLQFNISS